MKIPNPMTPNDWNFKHFLYVVIVVQSLVLLGIWPLADFTPFREVIGLLYLLFIPGIIILRIARIHKISPIKTLLFAVGFSIATLMVTGLVMNALLPVFGISRPLSTTLLAIGLGVVVMILCLVAWLRDRKFGNTEYVDIKGIFSIPVLWLCLMPVMSILGTQLLNYYDNNIVLMLLIVMIALTVILVGFTRLIQERYHPWAIFTITLSLLFYRSLISQYISGFDIHGEYAAAAMVQSTGYWESSYSSLINGLISINVLPTIISDISGISMTLVFKVIYPLFFSIACVGLYGLFKNQTNAKIAFFAVIFIVIQWRVYYDIVLLPRQLTASLFLVASLFLIVETEISRIWQALFFTVISFALVLSHYGLTYIYVAMLAGGIAVELLAHNSYIKRIWKGIRSRLSEVRFDTPDVTDDTPRGLSRKAILVPVVLFVAIGFSWYFATAGGAALNSLVVDIVDFVNYASANFFSSGEPQTVITELPATEVVTELPKTAISGILNRAHDVSVYLQELLIIIGGFIAVLGISELKLSRTYLYICVFPIILFIVTVSALSFSLLFITIIFLILVLLLPPLRRRVLLWLTLTLAATLVFAYFFPEATNKIAPPSLARLITESGSDADRLQHIALLFLAPFMVIGCISLVRVIIRSFAWPRAYSGEFAWGVVISVFLGFVFLLNTGFLWQVTGTYHSAPVLNQTWVKEQGNVDQKAHLYAAITMDQDVYSAEWLRFHMVPGSNVYGTFDDDYVHPLASYGLVPDDKVVPIRTTLEEIPEASYVYLQYLNVVEGIGTIWDRTLGVGAERHVRFGIADTTFLWEGKNKIYSNGGSEIYR
ncbi:DUF2206 domain-containing protein [Chloroflexota bacterium]